jgi:hypothetical protein
MCGQSLAYPSELTRAATARAVRHYFIPDLALTASLITLFYCLFLFHGYQALFRDSDAGWHIRTGESILATAAIPHTDPYSFTRPGNPWFAWEWASDALTGAVHQLGGLSAVASFYALAIAATVWLWFQFTWILEGSFLIACLFVIPMLSTTDIHWLARPHVIGWLFLLVALIAAEKASQITANNANGAVTVRERTPDLRAMILIGTGLPAGSSLRYLIIAAALTALWANMHASFFLAPIICAIYAVSHTLRPLIWDLPPESQRARFFATATIVTTLASLLNPQGWRLHQHLLQYLTDAALLARIGEFQSFNFHAEGAFQITLTLSLAMLGAALALSQKQLAHFLLSTILIYAALRSARGLPLVALGLLPIANAAITRALSTAPNLRPTLRRAIHSVLSYSSGLRAIDARFSGLGIAPLVAVLLFAFPNANAGFPADQFPVAAANLVDNLPIDARILAPDKFGGYLIYRFSGSRKVFFDGRSDLYGAEFLTNYARLTQLRSGWRAQLDEFGFTHALLPNDYSLVPALQALGWKRLYADGTATLLAR